MKLHRLSMFVLAIIMTSSVIAAEVYNQDGNKLDLFGRFNGIRSISSSDNKNSDHSFVNYGFNGETRISEGVTGFGTLEREVKLNYLESESTRSNSTHLGFVGIKFANAGSIDYGRNYGILCDISSWTNIIPEFSGNTISVTDNFMTGRTNSVFTYRNSNFFGKIEGLNFALQYQGKNNNKKNVKIGRSLNMTNGDGYGLSVTYDFGNGFSAGTAYTSSNRTLAQRMIKNTFHSEENTNHSISHNNKENNERAEAYSIGLKYDAYNIYLAALYSDTRNMTPYSIFPDKKRYSFADTAYNIELVAQYKLDFGLRPSVGYLQSKIDDNFQGKNQIIKKYFGIGTSYNFNKNMLTFIDYRINLFSKNIFAHHAKISNENILAIGMSYMF